MAQFSSEPAHARSRRSQHRGRWAVIAVLLAAVLVGTLWVPLYNKTTPTWGGWPFFYWYQLLWVPIVALVSWCAYLLSKRPCRVIIETEKHIERAHEEAAVPA